MIPSDEVVQEALRCAGLSPCSKSRRGVVIYEASKDHDMCSLISEGFNHPPTGFECSGTQQCRDACGKICVHAEAAALLAWVRARPTGRSFEMVHVKSLDGRLVPSGGPSCWQCSRLILEAEIDWVWLYHEDGWYRYSAREFHSRTLEACGLPGG